MRQVRVIAAFAWLFGSLAAFVYALAYGEWTWVRDVLIAGVVGFSLDGCVAQWLDRRELAKRARKG